jgi:hypothetical protein
MFHLLPPAFLLLMGMNLLFLALLSLFFPGRPVNLGAHLKCSKWQGRCVKCRKLGTWLQGLLCANFSWSVLSFPPCQQMWCGRCYASSVDVKFSIKQKALAKYEELDDPNEQERLQVSCRKMHKPDDKIQLARNGDHCMVPFKCNCCVFEN